MANSAPYRQEINGEDTFRTQPTETLASNQQQPSSVPPQSPIAKFNTPQTPVHRLDAGGSVQAIVVDDDVLIAGLEGGEIAAWSLTTYKLLSRVEAHEQSVLGLHLSADGSYLFSCGVDSVVNVWAPDTFEQLFSLYSHFEIGDIFSLSFSPTHQTVFSGAQNASLQWYSLPSDTAPLSPTAGRSLSGRKHRFFDSLGPGGQQSASSRRISRSTGDQRCHSLYFPRTNYLPFAHKSYIYCIITVKGVFTGRAEEEVLITGAGDGAIKIWSLRNLSTEGLAQISKFKIPGQSILSLTFSGLFLYAGLSNGAVHVYNLASKQLVQKMQVPYGDVNSVRVLNGLAFCGTIQGWVKKFDSYFVDAGEWRANNGKILTSAVIRRKTHDRYVTAGNDNTIAFWNIAERTNNRRQSSIHGNDELMNSLKEFVTYRTVAGSSKYIRDCHEAVSFLRKRFSLFGASTKLLPVGEGINPIFLARFHASHETAAKRTVLFYGHYDIVDAESGDHAYSEDWIANPFQLHPLNGYLYGRGVTDNKGPILAALYAVASLVESKSLSCNVVFLLEGEEEVGSRGFQQVVKQHKESIGPVDHILLSNSYWLDDHIPCLTYGMRGVVHATVTVSSGKPDRHSGMDGKARQHEPLKDLTVLLSSLTGSTGTQIMIPGFFDRVLQQDPSEVKQYLQIAAALAPGHPEIKDQIAFAESLMQRWREPNLTIHRVEVPESKTAVTISRFAKATLSIRIVPGQDAAQVASALTQFLEKDFAKLHSTNQLEVAITSKADAWLGQPSNQLFQTLERAITDVWNPDAVVGPLHSPTSAPGEASNSTARIPKKPTHRRASSLASKGTFTPDAVPRNPLYIREGGSIPVISFLEREFDAPAAMFPMGQSSDNAHLSNERMRVENLYKGREVLKRVFVEL